MAKYLETVYVSGWQSSSTASSSLEPGPDLADYPSNTVPLKVAQLFTAQLFHDRKQRFTRLTTPKEQREALGKPVDYLRPIVADADTVSLESGRVGLWCHGSHGGKADEKYESFSAGPRWVDGGHEVGQDDGRSRRSWDPYRRSST